MIGIVDRIKSNIPDNCRDCGCDKDNCSVSVAGVQHYHIMVNVDCSQIKRNIRGRRCDCLFIGEYEGETCIVPIELKTTKVEASAVRDQLQGCSRYIQKFLTDKDDFDFIPVLARAEGKPIRQKELDRLRKEKIRILGGTKKGQTRIMLCGESLSKVLHTNAEQ